MSSLEEHEAEQARITEECMEGTCDHPECHEDRMEWEYRFVNMPSKNGGKNWIELREVYCYAGNGKLIGHTDPCLGCWFVDGVKHLTQLWLRASELPVMHENQFPPGGWE